MYYIANNIHEKVSPFWLVKSSAVFFRKQSRKELVQCKKRKQTKHSDWSMIKETYRWPIKAFVFKPSTRPEWRNWWRNFPRLRDKRAFLLFNHFKCMLLISNQMIFLVQFGINTVSTCKFFKDPKLQFCWSLKNLLVLINFIPNCTRNHVIIYTNCTTYDRGTITKKGPLSFLISIR